MYRMSLMTFLLDGKGDLDRTKCMELGMSLSHTHGLPSIKRIDYLKKMIFPRCSVLNHILALVHDLAESIVGDITPYCGVSKEEKRLREMNAMQEITKLIAPRGERLMELFEVKL